MFSEEEKRQVVEALDKMNGCLEAIKKEQLTQNRRLDKLDRAVEDNPENNNLGMRTKVNVVYETVQSWQYQVKGARWVVGVLVFFFTSGLAILLFNAFTGGAP